MPSATPQSKQSRADGGRGRSDMAGNRSRFPQPVKHLAILTSLTAAGGVSAEVETADWIVRRDVHGIPARTERTFSRRAATSNGFWINATSLSSVPRVTITASVYPEV